MIHPSNLLRTHSEGSRFTAPRQIGAAALFDEGDCGLRQLPCFAKCLRLERAYTSTVFVICVAILAALHACAAAYYVATAGIWRQNYHLSVSVAEWVLYIAAILGGSFALLLSHWGNHIHRPSYVGALAMLHAVAGWTLIVPELYHPNYYTLNTTDVVNQSLCRLRGSERLYSDTSAAIYDEGKQYITLAIIIIYQLLHGFSFVSLIAHGISYLDDGCRKYAATTLICVIAISMQLGRFVGVNLTYIPVAFNRHIFFSIAWLITMTGIFFAGFAVSLFPKYPKRVVIKYGVNCLLNRPSDIEETKHQGFFSSLAAILSSKFLMLNVFTAAVMHAALSNFRSLRTEFFRSRFVDTYEGIDYRTTYRNIMQTTFVCGMATILAITAAKQQAKFRFHVIWVAVAYGVVALLFASYAFLKCEDRVSLHYRQLQQGCNAGCGCSVDTFAPVCIDGRTLYSACYAGCTAKEDNFYTSCYCGPSLQSKATDGACNNEKCKVVAILAEGNTVITFGLHLSALIGHVILALKAVPDRNLKAVSLGVLLTLTLLMPFLPFRILYEVIKSSLCAHIQDGDCIFFKDSFPTAISALTVVLMVVAVALALGMLPFIKQLEELRRSRPKSTVTRRTLADENSLREEPEGEHEEDQMIPSRVVPAPEQIQSHTQGQIRDDPSTYTSNEASDPNANQGLIYQNKKDNGHVQSNQNPVSGSGSESTIGNEDNTRPLKLLKSSNHPLSKSGPRPASDTSLQVESEGYTDTDIDRELKEKLDRNRTKILTRQEHVKETNF